MYVNVLGINILICENELFQKSKLNEDIIEKIDMIINVIEFETYNTLLFMYNMEEISIHGQDGVYQFVYDHKVIIQIDTYEKIWNIKANIIFSKESLEEVFVKKVFPFYFYKTNKALPIHATAIYNKKITIALMGYSTVGKSTLAANFIYNSDFHLLTDDIFVLYTDNEQVFTYNSYSPIKLRTESSAYFKNYNSKYIKTESQNLYTKKNINKIFFIKNHNENHITITKVDYNMKVQLLLKNLYAINANNYTNCLLSQISKIVNHLDFYCVQYKKNFSQLNELMEKIHLHA